MNRSQGFSAADHLPSTRLGLQEEGTLCAHRQGTSSPLLRVFCSFGGSLHPYTGSPKYRGLLTFPGQPSTPGGMESRRQKASVSGSSGEQFWETFYSISWRVPSKSGPPRLTRRASDARSLCWPFLPLLSHPFTPGPRSLPQKFP